jgi:hypothetical protein
MDSPSSSPRAGKFDIFMSCDFFSFYIGMKSSRLGNVSEHGVCFSDALLL